MAPCPTNFWRRSLNLLRRSPELAGDAVSLDTGLNYLGEHSLNVVPGTHLAVSSTGTGPILPAVPGLYYIIRGYSLSAQASAANTSVGVFLNFVDYLSGNTIIFGELSLPGTVLTAQTIALHGLSLLCQPNTSVQLGANGTAPTNYIGIVYYDAVPLREG